MSSPRSSTHPREQGAPGPRPERPIGGYTILVVDDEEAVRRLASRMITWMGNQVLEARHAREALATIEEHNGPIHLVVTDIKMPGMNGRELGRIIEQRWPGMPILYMSGFASEVTSARATGGRSFSRTRRCVCTCSTDRRRKSFTTRRPAPSSSASASAASR